MTMRTLLGAAIIGLVVLQACVPSVLQKNVNRDVPARYVDNSDSTNSAMLNWREYYRDSNLVALIDSALAGNQELNIVLKEVDIAQYEMVARSGEYLPFVNLRAGGGVD